MVRRAYGHILSTKITGRAPGPAIVHCQHVPSITAKRLSQIHVLRVTQEGRKQLKNLTLDHWAGHRYDELLRRVDQLDSSIEQLSFAVKQAGQDRE